METFTKLFGGLLVVVVLMVAGGLLIRSFALVTPVNPGFDPTNVREAEVTRPQYADRCLSVMHRQ